MTVNVELKTFATLPYGYYLCLPKYEHLWMAISISKVLKSPHDK